MHKSLPMHRIPSNDPSPYSVNYNPNPHVQPHHRPPGGPSGGGMANNYNPYPDRPGISSRKQSGSLLRRGKTLTRPERAVAPVPLINPRLSTPGLLGSSQSGSGGGVGMGGALGSRGGSSGGNVSLSGISTVGGNSSLSGPGINWWKVSSTAFTWYIPNAFLRRVLHLDSTATRQAWREKVTFCWIAVILGGLVGFITMGLQRTLCPEEAANSSKRLSRVGKTDMVLGVSGWQFNVSASKRTGNVDFYTLSNQLSGQDITPLFTRPVSSFPACSGMTARFATYDPCKTTTNSGTTATSACPLPELSEATLNALGFQNTSLETGYDWDEVNALYGYMVVNGRVLNLSPYLRLFPEAILDDPVDSIIRGVAGSNSTMGKDATRLFWNTKRGVDAVGCLNERFAAGAIDKTTPGCFFAAIMLYVTLIVIMTIIMIRFGMACFFAWFIGPRMAAPPTRAHGTAISPSVLPPGANRTVNDQNGMAPWAGSKPKGATLTKSRSQKGGRYEDSKDDLDTADMVNTAPRPIIPLSAIGTELYTLCLVTCYSEGDDSIQGTLDSISNTDFPDSRKLLFVVCDGMITGSGEKKSTPDICISMLEADPRFGEPEGRGYIAVGVGAKRENQAKVYAGYYKSTKGHRTPMLIIVKTGHPREATDRKPGNRGKRDSQMILMNFISRVNYNDPFSPLDYDIFRKIQVLCGVTADYFELCLMVDADTRVYPSSLRILVNCMYKDPEIMGLCGETTIANKKASWVTMIQVFEYFISHHQAKAFESSIHTVSCLPGCFSIYRLKVRKSEGDDWVPILAQPSVCQEYSQSNPASLHEKSLLELGEDRFLSTLMIRTFPRRKMMFCAAAKCKTLVPDTFSVLLSQRRRWICSSIHNLIELMKVPNLCGVFCCSMSFIVLLELFGTIVLPVAVCLTYALIINTALQPPTNFQEAIPVILLVGVLGLPAILVLITTRRVVYVGWMVIYLISLPIWNFVLPAYSFIKMDDLSWGATRQVAGKAGAPAHEDKTAIFDGTSIPLRKWSDWERSRLRKLRRVAKRRERAAEMERRDREIFDRDYNAPPGSRGLLGVDRDDRSETSSVSEDIWGSDVGGYDETAPSYLPPPKVMLAHEIPTTPGQTMGSNEMQAMLEQGFEENSARSIRHTTKNASTSSSRRQPPDLLASQQQRHRNETSAPRTHPSTRTITNGGPHNGYPPTMTTSSGYHRDESNSWQAASSAVETRLNPGHAKKRSAGSSGPTKPGEIFRP